MAIRQICIANIRILFNYRTRFLKKSLKVCWSLTFDEIQYFYLIVYRSISHNSAFSHHWGRWRLLRYSTSGVFSVSMPYSLRMRRASLRKRRPCPKMPSYRWPSMRCTYIWIVPRTHKNPQRGVPQGTPRCFTLKLLT